MTYAAGDGGGGGAPGPLCPTPEEAIAAGLSARCGPFEVLTEGVHENGICCYEVEFDECESGRPFFLDGHAVKSPARWGVASDWGDGECGDTALDEAVRRELADAWCSDGLMEHASVASFGRFALELMTLGAPAELLAAAHQAALDEVRHARACFALAGRYAGRPVAPGPLPIATSIIVSSDMSDVAARTVLEGCIGETIAAIVAAEQLACATDPEVRAALSMIARDEAQHAELAWKSVAWALRSGGDAVRAAVRSAFAFGLNATVDESDDEGSDAQRAHGRLSGRQLRATRERARHEIAVLFAAMMAGDRNTATSALAAAC